MTVSKRRGASVEDIAALYVSIDPFNPSVCSQITALIQRDSLQGGNGELAAPLKAPYK